ncbi:MAG: hypothetical protein ACYCZD_12910 [Rhodanobacter sp.]
MNAARKRKPIEANDGSYGGMVLAAFDALARDPHTEPRHGDRVTVGTETREVEQVEGERVIYSWPGRIAVRTMYIDAWCAWAAAASAWTVAEVEPA